jgi:RNA polymerase sigma-70 factor (ECF subfamily)
VDDAALVAGTLAGRHDCFEALVERHQRAVHGLAYRWLGDHTAAGEVVQATFVQAYTHLADFRGDASFRGWLCGIALNEVRSQMRARRRVPLVALDDVPESVLPQADAPAADVALRHRLARSVGRLPPRQRAVVTLRVGADLPFKEVARLEGISENAAKVSYHLAIKRLREWLGQT